MASGGLQVIGIRLLSFAAFIAMWQLATVAADSHLLPSPATVIAIMGAEAVHGDLPFHVGITLARAGAAFVIAMVIGGAIGIALGRMAALNQFFDGWLILFLNIPALVTIVLCYVWFGLGEAVAVAAVAINKIPNVIVTLREGARVLSRDNLEMAAVYRFGRLKTLRHVILPELSPFILAAARSGLALIWKIVLVVELLGRSNGVGFQIYLYFSLFDVASILAYTIAFVAVIQLIEFAILLPLDRHVVRWRR